MKLDKLLGVPWAGAIFGLSSMSLPDPARSDFFENPIQRCGPISVLIFNPAGVDRELLSTIGERRAIETLWLRPGMDQPTIPLALDPDAVAVCVRGDDIVNVVLDEYQLTKGAMNELWNLPRLQRVTFDQCRFDNDSCEGVESAPSLTSFSVHAPTGSLHFIRDIAKSPTIQEVSISAQQIRAINLRPLARLRRLRKLSISSDQIGDTMQDAAVFRELNQLEILEISDTSVGDNVAEAIAENFCLEELILAGTSVSNRGLAFLTKCPRLRRLFLVATHCDEQGTESILRMPSLRLLQYPIRESDWERIHRERPEIRNFDERHMTNPRTTGWQNFLSGVESLFLGPWAK